MGIFRIALAAAAGYYLYSRLRRSSGAGSQTNASDAVDNVELGSNPSPEAVLDEGVKETFPASDPVAAGAPSETAYEKQKRLRGRIPNC